MRRGLASAGAAETANGAVERMVSAGAAETANGAVERMVLLGLTGVYYIISAAMRLRCGRNQTAAAGAAILTHAQSQACIAVHRSNCGK